VTDIAVEEVTEVTPDLLAALHRLVPQLSRSAPPITEDELAEIVRSPGTRLLLAKREGTIVGTLTLVLFRIPTGLRGWIEDVVVDESARGQGVGEALTAEGVRLADEAGVRTLDLTSRQAREAAHRLYSKLGFRVRDTSVYRHEQG
jgi:ribosomal protein S18 acetylase RimI-like enzyme